MMNETSYQLLATEKYFHKQNNNNREYTETFIDMSDRNEQQNKVQLLHTRKKEEVGKERWRQVQLRQGKPKSTQEAAEATEGTP